MEIPSISALEFTQIRESIKNYIKNTTDFKDYDFEGSNLSMLLDILAYNSMYSSYNINMAANELNLDTAVLRDNVVSHAKKLGYTPNSYTSAKINYNITVNNLSNFVSVVIPAGVLFTTTQNNKTYTFITKKQLSTNTQGKSSVTFNNVEVYEGTEFAIRYTVDSSNENQRFFVPNNFVDVDSIRVSIISDPTTTEQLEVEYTKIFSIVGVSSSDRIFFVEEVQDQKYEIIFGDDLIGRKLQNGEIVIIRYIVSSGSVANNILSSQLSFKGSIKKVNPQLEEQTVSGNDIVTVSLSNKTDGGSEFENIKSIKYRAPRYYSAQQRAVVNDDYESILQNIYPNSDLVRVMGGEDKNPPQYGKVFISIKPKIGTSVSTLQKRIIEEEIKKYTVGSIIPVVEDALKLFISINFNIIYDKSKTTRTLSELINLAEQIILKYNLDDEFKNFSGIFSSSKLLCDLREIDSSIKFIVPKYIFYRPLQLFSGISYEYKLDFYTKLRNKVDNKYTLISDPFCVSGYNEPLFLGAFGKDFSGCDEDRNKNIYLITQNERVIDIVGNINYDTGLVSCTITSCQDEPINIYVLPENPDITTGPDTYPELISDGINPISDASPDDFDNTAELPGPGSTGLTPDIPPSGDPNGENPVTDIPGTTTTNPDGSVTNVDDDGTATTTNPDGSTNIEPGNDTGDGGGDGGGDGPTLDDDFTPTNPDTCT